MLKEIGSTALNVTVHEHWYKVWKQLQHFAQHEPTAYICYENLKAVEGYLEIFMNRDSVFFSERGMTQTMPLPFYYTNDNEFDLASLKQHVEEVYLSEFIVVVESITIDTILEKIIIYAYSFERNTKFGEALMCNTLSKERKFLIDQFLKDNV